MKLFEGLYSYEIILLCLGVLLFIVVLAMMIIYTIQKRSVNELISYFIVTIIMIAYPSVKKFSFDKWSLELDRNVKEVEKDPSSSVKRSQMENALTKIENRPTHNSQRLLDYAKAQAILGDTVKAISFVDKALALSPGNKNAEILQNRFNTRQVQIEKIIKDYEANRVDNNIRARLQTKVAGFAESPSANTSELLTAAKANALLGDTSKVISFTDAVLKKDSKNTSATDLRKKFSMKPAVKKP